MANKSISQLTAGGAVSGTDLFPDVQTAGVGPVKVTATQLATFFWYQPTLVNPALGAATATSINIGGATLGSNVLAVNGSAIMTSLALGGATIGSNNLAVTGTTLLGGATTVSSGGLTIGVAGTTGGTIELKGSTAGTLTLQVPATVTDYSITFPGAVAAGNGYILTSTTGGVTSWTNPTALGIDLDVGTTAITNGTTTRILYDNAGVLGEYSITGTGDVVMSNSPTFVDDITLGTQGVAGTQGAIILTNTANGSFSTTVKSSNSSTSAWTMTLPVTVPAGNSYVLTSDTNGVTAWSNPTALGIDLDVGTTVITNGTSTRILYNNSGVLGEYTVTGTGTTAVLSTSPTFTTSIIDPLVIGGTGTTSTLTLRSTSGVGTTGADIIFQAGNNGATEIMRATNAGNLLLGGTAARATTPGSAHLDIFNGTAPAGTLTNGISLYSSSGDFHFMTSAGDAFKVGYRNVPPVGTKTGSYPLATGDVGKYVQVSTGGSITIPDLTFAEGDIISIFNNTTGNITITCSIATAYIAGTDTDKATMTLATRGVATVLFISSTVCVVSGNVS